MYSPRLKCLFAQRALGAGRYVQPHIKLVSAVVITSIPALRKPLARDFLPASSSK
jgi:hypothetical protein